MRDHRFRNGLTFFDIMAMFWTEDRAGRWFEAQRWPDGPLCPHCGSFNVQFGIKHKTMTHRCRDCPNKPTCSLETGTVMHSSKFGYRPWAIAAWRRTSRASRRCVFSANLASRRSRHGTCSTGSARLTATSAESGWAGRSNRRDVHRREAEERGEGSGRRDAVSRWRSS